MFQTALLILEKCDLFKSYLTRENRSM